MFSVIAFCSLLFHSGTEVDVDVDIVALLAMFSLDAVLLMLALPALNDFAALERILTD